MMIWLKFESLGLESVTLSYGLPLTLALSMETIKIPDIAAGDLGVRRLHVMIKR
jgi:hypothetical protein